MDEKVVSLKMKLASFRRHLLHLKKKRDIVTMFDRFQNAIADSLKGKTLKDLVQTKDVT
ncbi:MAG: hypothetical protein KKH68_01165 [Proteobacteria bacterium]|nr:hypothetical protein [Pseudomonadota bacterium]